MDHIITAMGMDFFETSARRAVMKRARVACCPEEISELSCISHRDSLLCLKEQLSIDDDDTVASTLSASTSESSLSSRAPSVSFAQPVVTAVYYRPRTTLEEKAKLFYRESEYREFRHEYIYGRRQRKRVNFSSKLVSDVWAYDAQGEKSCLYYNQSDLQRCV